jgi:hypothetical protein
LSERLSPNTTNFVKGIWAKSGKERKKSAVRWSIPHLIAVAYFEDAILVPVVYAAGQLPVSRQLPAPAAVCLAAIALILTGLRKGPARRQKDGSPVSVFHTVMPGFAPLIF